MNNQNDIYEQLTSNKAQLANVRETLAHSNEMATWEVKEYQAVEAGYIAKIAQLNGFIAEGESKSFITKDESGTRSAYVYRIVAENGNGIVTIMPTMTRKTLVPVTGLRRVELTTHVHIDDLIEYNG